MDITKKKSKGKKMKIKDTYLQMKKMGAKNKVIQKKEGKKKIMNGDVKILEVTQTQKKTKKNKVGKNEELKVNNKKRMGEQTKPKKGNREIAAMNKSQKIEENGDHGKDGVKAGKRKREPEDNEKRESMSRKIKNIEKRKRILLIHFPESLVVKKQSHVKAIVGISEVNISFPNVQRGLSKGFCYVEFESEKKAKKSKKIIEEKDVNGEHFRVEYLGDKLQVQESQPPRDVDPLRLYVGRIPHGTTKDTLSGLFPTSSLIECFKGKKSRRGHALLTFKTEEEAKKVFEASKGLKVENSEVLIMFSYSRDKPDKEKDDSDLPTPAKKLKKNDVEMADDDAE